MNPETLEALKGSIQKWQTIVDGTGADKGGFNCPLCKSFRIECRDALGRKCPVAIAANNINCLDTPYVAFECFEDEHNFSGRPIPKDLPPELHAEAVRLAQAELDFLISLLPEEENG